MNKRQASLIIENTFNKAFNRDKFIGFAGNLFNLRSTNYTQRSVGVFDTYKQHVQSLEVVAKFSDGKNKIDVLIVTLVRDASLDKARIMQRNFVARYLSEKQGDAAIVAFTSPDAEDWRFSLIKMEYKVKVTDTGIKFEQDVTPAKRWSFLVGKNENSHTAQSQLVGILANDEVAPTLDELEQAFSIETVTNEFFAKYTDLFLRMKESLDLLLENDSQLKADFKSKEIDTADFAKKTMGQMAFLYFLQKKGWFGVAPDKEWGAGVKNFLRETFECRNKYGENFFDDVLEPLFYEALAQDRGNDAIYPKLNNCRIPFLNGGLFEPMNGYSWETTHIRLPDNLFSNKTETYEGDGILDVFDLYNFTVNESDPLEQEVAVDPEMLGKVFENLLEIKDRGGKGTFYTPRDIVHYMCQESLINYLETGTNSLIPKADIESFIQQGSQIIQNDKSIIEQSGDNEGLLLPQSISDQASELDDLLANIKVCDPAVGSGAFPLGMLTEIVTARTILGIHLRNNPSTYNLKLHAISNSIYGVDIDPGAVEIAKLRFWLSLVVEEDNPTPLPNLEHKIMQGNSLVSQYEGIELFDDDFLNSAESINDKKNEIQEKLDAIQKEYFSLHSTGEFTITKKVEIEKEIKRLQRSLKSLNNKHDYKVETSSLFDVAHVKQIAQQKAKLLQSKIAQYVTIDSKTNKENLKIEIDDLKWDLIEATLEERSETGRVDAIKQLRKDRIKPFFIWKLEFGDVFRDNGGFDIVIGNPPYVESRNKEKFPPKLKEDCQKGVESRWGSLSAYIPASADLMIYFFELSLKILSSNGLNSFIAQNSWLSTEYGKKFQNFLTSMDLSIHIEDSNRRHFGHGSGPSINTVISFIQKNINKDANCVSLYGVDLVDNNTDKVSKGRYRYDDNLLNYKWSILFHPVFIISLLKRINNIGSYKNYSIGQGINNPYACFYSNEDINQLKIQEEFLTPVVTKDDGSLFVINSTNKLLIDSNRLDAYESLKSVLDDVCVCNISKNRQSKKPALILPRGIGSYFCAKNNVDAYSSSFVEVYTEDDDVTNNLWLFLNSTIGFLLREVSGRFNLGGGMLKAESSDLKAFPLFIDFNKSFEIKELINKSTYRKSNTNIEALLLEDIQKDIDNIVYEHFGYNSEESEKITEYFIHLVNNRTNKSKT